MQHILSDGNRKEAGYDLIKPRLLLVDDEPGLLMSNGLALQHRLSGYDIVMALGPGRALSEIRRDPHGWAGIVTDFLMPYMHGADLLAASVIYSYGEHHYGNLFRLLVSSSREHRLPRNQGSIDLERVAEEMGVPFMLRPSGPLEFAAAVKDRLHRHQEHRGYELVDGHLVPKDVSYLERLN
ncbi:MAG TPA: hypothetical protein VJI15_01610 [Candidatus Nanoarchaeia archaeon]|nr:hypothetical protein [Candidatus Nanoarchaeia archaeon]